ncbi:MAG: hypothetical protein KJS66_06995 [Acidobacteria bacterium]|nr:hypothetical protein [Acidobacteriota bacterium]
MTINEAQRFELHAELRKILGDSVAGTLMDHLPPGGWADVARTRDVNQLHDRVDDRFKNFEERVDDRFRHFEERVDDRFKNFEVRIDRRFDSVVKGLWTIGTIVAGAFIGLFSLIVSTR